MTTQADIKLVIDQLDQICEPLLADDYDNINSAVDMLEKLGNQITAQKSEIASLRISYDAACMLVAQMHEVVMGKVVGPHHGVVEDVRNHIAAQAAVIEMLRDALHITANNCQYLGAEKWDVVAKALSITPDQALEQFAEKVREQCIAELWKGNKHGFHRSLEEAEDAIREMAKEMR